MSHIHSSDGRLPDSEPRRERPRDSLLLSGVLQFEGEAASREVRVRNLSAQGLMVDCRRVAEPGTPVTIEMRGIGRVAGKVAWCAEQRIGIALDEAIDPLRVRKPVGGQDDAMGVTVRGR